MKSSVSFRKGKGNINHNLRQLEKQFYIDDKKSKNNVVLVSKNLHDLYTSLFQEAVIEHDKNEKRNDRKIKDFYIYSSKKKTKHGQQKLFEEIVLQIGSSKERPNEETLKAIYSEYVKNFEERNGKNLVINCATIHLDEKSPHLHLDVVPISNCNKKMKLSNSFSNALKELGFNQKGKNQYIEFRNQEISYLKRIMIKYGIEYKNMGNINSHNATIHPETLNLIKNEVAEELLSKNLKYKNLSVYSLKESPFAKKEEFIKKKDADKLFSAMKTRLDQERKKNEKLTLENQKIKNKYYVKENEKLKDEINSKNESSLTLKNDYQELLNDYNILVGEYNSILEEKNSTENELKEEKKSNIFLKNLVKKLVNIFAPFIHKEQKNYLANLDNFNEDEANLIYDFEVSLLKNEYDQEEEMG